MQLLQVQTLVLVQMQLLEVQTLVLVQMQLLQVQTLVLVQMQLRTPSSSESNTDANATSDGQQESASSQSTDSPNMDIDESMK